MVAVQFECLLFFSTLGFFAALRGIPGISEKISREAAENERKNKLPVCRFQNILSADNDLCGTGQMHCDVLGKLKRISKFFNIYGQAIDLKIAKCQKIDVSAIFD